MEQSIQFDITEYSRRVYLLEIDAENGVVNKKFVLQ